MKKRSESYRRVILRNLSQENLGKRLKEYSARSDVGYVEISFNCRPGIPFPPMFSEKFKGDDGCFEFFLMSTRGEMDRDGLVGVTMVSEDGDCGGDAKVTIPCEEIAAFANGRLEAIWYEKGIPDPGRADALELHEQDMIDFPAIGSL